MKNILKITGQILLILLAASLVIGALYLAVNSNLLSSLSRPDGGPERRAINDPGSQLGVRPPAGGRDFEGGRGGPDFGRGIIGMAGSLVKIGIITMIVLAVQALFSRAKKPQTQSAT